MGTCFFGVPSCAESARGWRHRHPIGLADTGGLACDCGSQQLALYFGGPLPERLFCAMCSEHIPELAQVKPGRRRYSHA
jgi:hypothetical protein